MDKEERKQITTEEIIHNVYCDHCGKHLGGYKEHPDGYWSNPYSRRINLGNGYNLFHPDLCDACYNDFNIKKKEVLGKLIDEYNMRGSEEK